MTGKLIGSILREDGTPFLEKVFLAETWWSRLRGLQFLPKLHRETGLIIKPCRSIHTFWMRFPIHVIFIDNEYRVLECREALRPWKTTWATQSESTLILEISGEQTVPSVGEKLILKGVDSPESSYR